MSESRNKRRSLQGVVVSDAMQETITVRVERRYKHPLYGKFVRSHKKYMAHDAENAAKLGNLVAIVACRPLSKPKRWRLERIISSSNVAPLATEGGQA